MTTIAWDGKTLAADRQTSYGTTPMPSTKIEKIKWKGKEALIGSAGRCEDCDNVIDWIKTGKNKPEIDDDNRDFSIIVVTKDDGVLYAAQSLYFHKVGHNQWAIGSGGDYALGAMKFGATAAQAIEIASQLDTQTGLGVDTLTFGKSK